MWFLTLTLYKKLYINTKPLESKLIKIVMKNIIPKQIF